MKGRLKTMNALNRNAQNQKLEDLNFECIGSSWLGGNFRDTWSDGEMTLEYRSETGLLHGRRKNGVEFVWEFDAEQNEFYEIEDL